MDWWNNLQNEWNNFWNFTHGGAPWNGQSPLPVPAQPAQSQVPPPAPQPGPFDNFGAELGRDFSNLGANAHRNAGNLAGDIGGAFSNLGTAAHDLWNAPLGSTGITAGQLAEPSPLLLAQESRYSAPPIQETMHKASPPPFIHTPHGPYYHPAFHPATGTNPHATNSNFGLGFPRANPSSPASPANVSPPVGAAHGIQVA